MISRRCTIRITQITKTLTSDRQTDTHTHTDTHRHTYAQTDRQTHTHTQTYTLTCTDISGVVICPHTRIISECFYFVDIIFDERRNVFNNNIIT